jgi:hypothetical protein
MIEGGKAAAIIVITAFVVFIVWAKTTHGKEAMRSAFGEPYSGKSKPRKRATSRSKKAAPRKRSAR